MRKKEEKESLLTKRSLALSLSPPRCPPFGTIHRSVLTNSAYPSTAYADFDNDDQAHSDYNKHSGIRERLMHLIYNNESIVRGLAHPHLPVGPELSDKVTRFLSTILPIRWLNHGRDSGFFRKISDGIVTGSIPLAALANPKAATVFLHLSQQMRVIKYGKHESQFIDMFFPERVKREELRGLVFFIHGGAWGSGKPWFYRVR